MQESYAFLICISPIAVHPTELKYIKKQVCACICVCVCVCVFQIRDGGSEYSPVLGKRYCGSELPPLVTSTQNLLWLKFHTDDVTDVQSVGFSAWYTSGPPGLLLIHFIKVVNITVFIKSLERISDTIWANGTFFQFMFVSHYFGSLNHQTECTAVIFDKAATNDLLLCCSGLSLSSYFCHCFFIFHLFSSLARTSC